MFASLNVPAPFTHSTPFDLKSDATPPVICLTTRGLPLVRLREVELGLGDGDAELAERVARLVEEVRGLHPRLRRDAADAQARAAELRLLLDADDLRPELRRADRGRVAAGAAAQDGDVTVHVASSVAHCRAMLTAAGLARPPLIVE